MTFVTCAVATEAAAARRAERATTDMVQERDELQEVYVVGDVD